MIRIICDSREQLPLTFDKSKFHEIVIEGMPVADYWASVSYNEGKDWKEIPICFERKGKGDLFGTMTNGYNRFRRELQKAKEFGLQVILVIEGSMRDIGAGYEYSQFSGDSMLKKLAMLHVKYGLEYHFFNDRREMARFIEETFNAVERHWKKHERDNKSGYEENEFSEESRKRMVAESSRCGCGDETEDES